MCVRLIMWWINIPIFAVFMLIFLGYRDYYDWNKQFLYRVAPGPCKYVKEENGSEDMTYIGGSIVIMTSDIAAGIGKGTLKALNLSTNEVFTMKIHRAPSRTDFMTAPHGLSTWTTEKNQTFVYVITHPSSGDVIEVFELLENLELKHKRSITDPIFRDMNDLVMVGEDKFYVTLHRYYKAGFIHHFEILTQRPWGGVVYYNGTKAKQVVSGLFLPNGINLSKDKMNVFVAEFGKKQLLAFKRSAENDLTKLWEKYSDSLLDNIEVDPVTGDLWIGCHPVAYRVFNFYVPIFGGLPLPSQVLRFKMKDNVVTDIEEIYADDSSELYGSSVATYAMGKLVIGTVYKETLVCDVKYLSE